MGEKLKGNGIGSRRKTGQCSICLLDRGEILSGREFPFVQRDRQGSWSKFITQKLSDFSPTLGLERKCMGWDFPEPRPSLVLLGNKFTQ